MGKRKRSKALKLEQGIQAVSSARGNSSHNHNPFIALKRPNADEFQGEALGFSFDFFYSGNFLVQVEVDTYDLTRVSLGINSFGFTWYLKGEVKNSKHQKL